MSTMVSARIPSDVYSRGVKNLKRMDSNVTDLVRAAFEYVALTEQLPSSTNAALKPGVRKFTPEQAREFQEMFGSEEGSINLPDNFDYKKELAEGKRRDYEALS